ncbi:uncharacterized protein LOC134192549 isoform X2 [Corticium candelabrum]|uniref:uncharacterized protein LOC134192549 isoform X2 n=1 Tax=Corticium candelabrum TaxID=121492 RepID=UPI002E25E752|nr:uncharacterized protein LOC134192549 isoform X2 [Corticium candelabrum]
MWTIVRRYPERGSCLAFVTIAGIILYLTVIAFRGQTSYLNILKARRERHTTNNESVTNNLATGLQLATTNSTTFGFDSVNSLVLFIGYPRSGHTLVGSLLDAHPHVVIANEYKLLQHWRLFDKEQKTRSYVFGELYRDSEMQAKEGYRSATVKHIFNYSVPNQWNGQFDKFLQLIGDKHGPKTTEFLKNENQRTIVDEIRRRLKTSGGKAIHRAGKGA